VSWLLYVLRYGQNFGPSVDIASIRLAGCLQLLAENPGNLLEFNGPPGNLDLIMMMCHCALRK